MENTVFRHKYVNCTMMIMHNILVNTESIQCIHISQGSVATQLRCGGMFDNHLIANGERILKIG